MNFHFSRPLACRYPVPGDSEEIVDSVDSTGASFCPDGKTALTPKPTVQVRLDRRGKISLEQGYLRRKIFSEKVRARIDLSPFFTKCFRTFVTDSYEISWGFENQRNETRNFASVFFNPRGEWSNNLQPVKSIALTRAKMHTWAQKPTAINNISM